MGKAQRHPAIVIGAGISGLAAARALAARGVRPIVLEACPSIGGLTRSIHLGSFTFDYTGHLLHLARYASPAAVPFADQSDDDWQRIERRSCCYFGGRLVTAPIQYHLGELPRAMLAQATASYESRPKPGADPSFRQFLISGFGQYLAENFLIPLNEKTMASGADRLTAEAARRFFPAPDDAKVRAGLRADAPAPREYNSQFWYPKRGGIDCLVAGLARGLEDLRTQEEVAQIDLGNRTAVTKAGSRFAFERLYSSAPLPWLCRWTGDVELTELAAGLTHSSTICINLGLRGKVCSTLEQVQWVYVADPELPFYRLGIYSNITGGLCPPDCHAMYVEQAVEGGRDVPVGEIEASAIRALCGLGWIERDAVLCSAVHVMRCAYVHHTSERQRNLAPVLQRLGEHGVTPIGRYGLWDHTSMEDSIVSGIEAAKG